ncbi:FRG domain-containing protein [Luteolibacter ambystomatis]|uniref:FRG domain-containing protein n=1 Tax=Luteolibacter ambystomatis TaxID=2824561 RepID=A0A975J1A7_9BACT|nr:FRG domain-containing protein [Luteolibacter ambystomatis]QUE52157.1 FRG domain-containing protein [Luteolibacter ambystomatis]
MDKSTKILLPRSSESTNFDPGPWKEVSRSNGIRTVEAGDFSAFFEFVNRGFGDTDTEHLWRGQKDSSWEILSSLGRAGKDANLILHRYRDAVARCNHVEYKIDGADEAAEMAKLRLWSLGQHHGLTTPLIDWTTYPYVALFFAFVEPDDSVESRSVFAINWGSVGISNFSIQSKKPDLFKERLNSPPYTKDFQEELFRKYGNNFRDEDRWMIEKSEISQTAREKIINWERTRQKKQTLGLYTPRTNENPRIHSQGGRHIYTPDNISIESWINQCASDDEVTIFGNILTKVNMPNSQRPEVLKCLNRMNINYLNLFPDLDGAARHCNLDLIGSRMFGIRDY